MMNRLWEKLISGAGSDLGLKLFSLFFAFGLWVFVNAGQKAGERSIEVPVELRNIPSNLIVGNPGLSQIELRVMGPPTILATLNPEQLKVVLDLEGARAGTSTFRVSSDSFNPPRGIRVTRVSPSEIHLRLESLASRVVPVKVRFAGKLPAGYTVAGITVTPETVRAQGPADEVNRLASVETTALEVEAAKTEITKELKLASPGRLVSLTPDRVSVSVKLEEEWIVREFDRVEVKAKDFSGTYSVTPNRVYIRMSGPKRVLADLKIGTGQLYLDLKGLGPGSHTVPLSLELPPQVKVLEQKPTRFRVRIAARKG